MLFNLKITGPEKIETAFSDFTTNMIRYGLQEPVAFVFKEGELQARTASPVRTGFLRSSIHADITARGARLAAAAPYAIYVDQGTSRMKAQPFFTNAVKYIQRTLPGLVQRGINEQAGRISRKFF